MGHALPGRCSCPTTARGSLMAGPSRKSSNSFIAGRRLSTVGSTWPKSFSSAIRSAPPPWQLRSRRALLRLARSCLDPAFENAELPKFLRKIAAPVMVLGADERISEARNRENFYRFIRAGVHEVSIRDATHEDAQYPSAFASTTEEAQITYASAIESRRRLQPVRRGHLRLRSWKSFSAAFFERPAL